MEKVNLAQKCALFNGYWSPKIILYRSGLRGGFVGGR